MALTILHTNDFHGALTPDRAERLASLRAGADLYYDCGDAVKTGNLGVPLKQEAVWEELDRLRCTASILGNRETHVLEAAFKAKLAGARHPILCANLKRRPGERPLPGHLVVEVGGLRVGAVGVMVAMVTERMATRAASAYLWDAPIPVAIAEAQKLRPQVDILIALTHIGFRQDQELARQCDLYDLILGGHSHTVLEQPVKVEKTWICQTGSHGRFAGLYEWDAGLVNAKLIGLT